MLPWLWAYIGLHYLHNYLLTITLYAGLGCLLPAILLYKERYRILPLKLDLPQLLFAILLGNLLLLGGWPLLNALLIDWTMYPQYLHRVGLNTPSDYLLLTVYMIFINPITEELFWRGLIYDRLTALLSQKAALFISAIGFGAWHWVVITVFFKPGWDWVVTLLIILAGFAITSVYARSRTLFAPILIHSLGADLPIMLIFFHSLYKAGMLP